MEGGLPYPLLKCQVYLSLFLYLFESYLQCLYLYQALEFHLVIQVYFIIFCFTLLCCFVVVVSFCFLNWVCGNSAWSKSTGAIFPTAFAYFFYLHHILVILPYIPNLHQQKLKTTVSIFFSNEVFLDMYLLDSMLLYT